MRLLPLLALQACVFIAAPEAPPPGTFVIPDGPMEGDAALSFGLHRNLANGVEVDTNGDLSPAPSELPVWPGLDLTMTQGINERIGVAARLSTSVGLPLPVPIPNGFSVAPIFELAHPAPDLGIYTSPQLVRSRGVVLVDSTVSQTTNRLLAHGVDVPVTLRWHRLSWLDLQATAYGRGFLLRGVTDINDDDDGLTEGTPGYWLTSGGGLSVHAGLTLSAFRVGLGAGFEVSPRPLPGQDPCEFCAPIGLHPQATLSTGGTWGAGPLFPER